MKYFTLFFALILQPLFLISQDFQNSAPVTVASGYGNYHPQIEVLGDNELGMIWTDASANNLYFTKRTGPEQFATPLKLNPDGLMVQDYNWSGPDLCAWGNNVYVAFHDLGFDNGHIYLVKSTDNGLTFGDTVRVDDLTDAYAQFPDIAVYNDTIYVVFMRHGFTPLNPQMVLSRSVDGGQTFEAFVDATGWAGEEACDCCQPEIIVDDEKIIIFYRQNASNIRDIKAVVSYDRGATFTQYISVDDHNWSITACPSTGPDARFLENGNPVCVYRTTVSSQARLFINEYDLIGNSSVNLVELYTDGIANSGINYPQISVNGSMIGIVWEGLGSSTDVFFNGSNTGVVNLLPTNAINVTNMIGSQSKPDVIILNGVFHVIYSELSGAEVKYVTINAVNSIETNSSENVHFYPNPVTENLSVDISDAGIVSGTISIYDLTGRIVSTSEFSSPITQVSTSDLTGGMYFVKITGNDKTVGFSFVKE